MAGATANLFISLKHLPPPPSLGNARNIKRQTAVFVRFLMVLALSIRHRHHQQKL